MKVLLAKIRLWLHLLSGVWMVAMRFPRASETRKFELTRAWSLKMLRLVGMRLVIHHDKARLDRGALVVGNHVSWLDIHVVNAWRPTPVVAKAEVRDWPFIGRIACEFGTVFVDREKPKDAYRAMHEMAARLAAGGVMCLFPEGTTSDGLTLLPFHANLFQSAVSAGCAVQPICLRYEDEHGRQSTAPAYIGDVSLSDSIDAMLRARPLTAHLYVGTPIAPATDRRALAAQAREAVAAALTQLQEKGQAPTKAVYAATLEDGSSAEAGA